MHGYQDVAKERQTDQEASLQSKHSQEVVRDVKCQIGTFDLAHK